MIAVSPPVDGGRSSQVASRRRLPNPVDQLRQSCPSVVARGVSAPSYVFPTWLLRNEPELITRTSAELARNAQSAEAAARALSRADPSRPRALLDYARILIDLARLARNRSSWDADYRFGQQAIGVLEQVVTDHPTFAEMDEILFRQAIIYQNMYDPINTLRVCSPLVERFPNSHLLPNIFLLCGDVCYGRNSMSEAMLLYDRAAQSAPQGSMIRAVAYYRLAWSLQNLRQGRLAQRSFAVVVQLTQALQNSVDARALEAAARREICDVPVQ